MRFGQDLPKQFAPIRGRPLLMHCIELFHLYDPDIQIIVGIRQNLVSYWESECAQLGFNVSHTCSPGGETRFHTVKNALPEVNADRLVAIHDAVRPLLYRRTIEACFEAAEKFGASLPCVPIHDSIREITPEGSRRVSREHFRQVQTPQAFRYDILARAYQQEYSEDFTDDASVVEMAGFPVALVEGNSENIKITTPEDLMYAEAVFDSYREKSGFFS
jgi:2-C-methyl-D-erythritol 4-phosphate cytidylyltransferase